MQDQAWKQMIQMKLQQMEVQFQIRRMQIICSRYTCISHLATVGNHYFFGGFAVARTVCLDLFDNIHSLSDSTENNVLAIQPWSGCCSDKELGPVGVRACIGHGKGTWSYMLDFEILVGKLFSINRFASSAVMVGEVPTLKHELRDHSMECRTLVSVSLLPSAQLSKVLGRLRHHSIFKLYHNFPQRYVICSHFQKDWFTHLYIQNVKFKKNLNLFIHLNSQVSTVQVHQFLGKTDRHSLTPILMCKLSFSYPPPRQSCYFSWIRISDQQYVHYILDLSMQRPIILAEFPYSNYDLTSLQLLGEGSYGRVYKSRNLATLVPVAIKQINMATIRKQNLEEALKAQIELMRQLKSEYTVELIDAYVGQENSYMIMELCESDLRKKMCESQNKFKEEDCIDIFCNIMNGFRVLVENECIHRDVKPENILIKGGRYKIGDFGFARKADMLGRSRYLDMCGTPIYMAPQILNNQPYTSKCDIWSLGLLLYQMIYGSSPWPVRCIEAYSQAIRRRPLAFPFDVRVGKQTKDFIKKALIVDEDRRMSWEEVFTHALIKNRIPGEVILTKPVEPKVRLILSKMQDEADRKFIDQIEVFKKYETHDFLIFQQFQALLKELNPSITSYQIKMLFDACDKNQNGSIERTEFENMFCTVNYQTDPQLSREIDEIVSIIRAKQIQLKNLFDQFDKNKTGALDSGEFKQMILSIAPKYSPLQIQKLYKNLDHNGTGVVEKKQFLEVVGNGLTNQKNYVGIWLEKAKRNMKMLKIHLNSKNLSAGEIMTMADLDMDRHLDSLEFQKLMDKIGFMISKDEVADIFKMVDANGSGSISMRELIDYLH